MTETERRLQAAVERALDAYDQALPLMSEPQPDGGARTGDVEALVSAMKDLSALVPSTERLSIRPHESIDMLLWCPACGARHYDDGEYSSKLHHTHACQSCGMVWRPAVVFTRGVRFLPGFKNADEVAST